MLPFVTNRFDFRVLRENRRVVQDEARREEIENFHEARVCCGMAPLRFPCFPFLGSHGHIAVPLQPRCTEVPH